MRQQQSASSTEKLNQECDRLLANLEKLDSENQELLKKLQDTRVDRDELDRECDRLSVKAGDLDLEKQNLADQLEQVKAELEKVRSHSLEPTANTELPEPAELLNQFKKKLPKSKISLREVELLLELL